MRFDRSTNGVGKAARATRGFTLVELLVVVVIITILISAVLVASSTLIAKAKSSATLAVLTVVRDAVEQFEREQAAPRNKWYRKRYGAFPPDELEVFTDPGVPGANPATHSLAVGKAMIVPAPTSGGRYPDMKGYTKGLPLAEAVLEHRDLVAMIVGIEEWGDASTQILHRIQDRYWVQAPLEDKGKPAIFLDRPDTDGDLDEKWGEGDLQIRYIVDDWGTPLSYLAQRDWDPPKVDERSSNHPDWNEASTELIRLNGGQPIIMSYGPDGPLQLTSETMGTEAEASIVGDFKAEGEHENLIDNLLNVDNVYADPSLKAKLAKGIE